MLEGTDQVTGKDVARMQADTVSLRAVEALPPLINILKAAKNDEVQRAGAMLESWDGRMDPGSAAAAIFEMFFQHWSNLVAAEQFDDELTPLMSGAVGGLALELLSGDHHSWFVGTDRESAVVNATVLALAELRDEMGPDVSDWSWGGIHTIKLPHMLGGHSNPLAVPGAR